MSWGWMIFTYLIIWCITLLPMLSLWVQLPAERTPEHYAAAPKETHLKRKLVINSLVSAVIVLLIHLLLKSGVVPLRNVV